ncbi:MAG: hypothetical protein WC152_05270 [Candidatus Izemoplasmatales bacterium]
MKLEKFYNSMIFRVFDFVYNLVLFNIFFILTFISGLGIFSYMLAFITLVLAIKSLDDGISFSIVKRWVINLKMHFVKALKLSIFYTLFLGLFIFDVLFFNIVIQEQNTIIFQVLYYLFLVLTIVMAFGTINAAFVFVYFPHLSVKKIIKYSFMLIQLVPIPALFLIFGIIVSVFLFYVFPIILVFIWFSLIFYVYHKLIKKTYLKLVPVNQEPLNITN